MLKDLDERQTEQQGGINSHSPIVHQTSSHKSIILIVLILILFNIIGFLGWKVYVADNESSTPTTSSTPSKSTVALPKAEIQTKQVAPSNKIVAPEIASIEAKSAPKLVEDAVMDSEKVPDVFEKEEPVVLPEKNNHEHSRSNNANHIHSHKAVKPELITQAQNNQEDIKESSKKPAEAESKPKSTMSVSRKNLSPKVLISQKITRAENALEKNEISRAEKLLEEVLLLDPKQVDSRKKLAALWFGREAFTDAISLINQGLNITPNDIELRLMKARIYLSKNKPDSAYASLKKLSNTQNIEYLSLLATLAQQLNQLPMAIESYTRLTTLQPEMGKWWLGLGVAFDSNSQFKEAAKAYKNALLQNDMSRATTAFAKRRISELGE